MKNYRLTNVLIASLMAWSIGSACAQPPDADAPAGDMAMSTAVKRFDPAIVQANMQNLQRQAALINQLADKFQPEADAQFGAGFNAQDWRRDFGARLMYQSLEALSNALNAPNLSVVQNELYNGSQNTRAKHTTDANWVINYLPVPCRIVDTRLGGGGVLGPAYRYWTASTVTPSIIAGQGGNLAGCGNFPNAEGFVLYVTVVPAVPGPNFLTVQHNNFPTPPATATMTYYSQVLSNFAVTSNASGGVHAYTSGNTHVVIDLLAWTGNLKPIALECVDMYNPESASVASGVEGCQGPPACAAGYTETGLLFNNSSPTTGLLVTQLNGPSVGASNTKVCAYNYGSPTRTFNSGRRCCRVPISGSGF